MKSSKFWISVGVGLCLIVGVTVGIVLNRSKEPPKPANREEFREFVTSDKFKNLSDEEKRKHMRSMMRDFMDRSVDKYLELTPEEKTVYLDQFIDRMEQHRKNRPAPADGEQPRGPGRMMDPENMRKRTESLPAEQRAKFHEFFNDLHNRMDERGIKRPGM